MIQADILVIRSPLKSYADGLILSTVFEWSTLHAVVLSTSGECWHDVTSLTMAKNNFAMWSPKKTEYWQHGWNFILTSPPTWTQKVYRPWCRLSRGVLSCRGGGRCSVISGRDTPLFCPGRTPVLFQSGPETGQGTPPTPTPGYRQTENIAFVRGR